MKLLFWDGTGVCLLAKRLEGGKFRWPKLSLDSMKSLQDLADEAFRDLLKKHRRPTTLREMLKESARSHTANDRHPRARNRSS